MKHKLLVAVDGEKASLRIIDYVARACVGSNDEEFAVVVFHVLPAFPIYDYMAGVTIPIRKALEWFDDRTRLAATEILAMTKETLVKQGLKAEQVTTEIAKERGNIAPQILQAAADHNCDTIVVGRRGGSMVAAFLLGSVVEHLLRNPVGFAIWVVE
ncbi:MAG TPA: universal stress protein [Verrucomicrobiae bacterium]|nr:universal stress protein [Verrucomicrobiae bacterium]